MNVKYEYESLWLPDPSQAIIDGDIEVLDSELKKGWKINEPLARYFYKGIFKFPIMLAIQYNNLKSVMFLIENGARLDIENEHALLYAVEYSDDKLIQYVVEKGAKGKDSNIAYRVYSLLCKKNRFELIPALVKIGIDINPYGIESLSSAIFNKEFSIIERFLYYGIDLNQCVKTEYNRAGHTPLCQAAFFCDGEMLNYLITKGANPLITNISGERPYHLALQANKLDNARLLKEYEQNLVEDREYIQERLPKDYLDFASKGRMEFVDPNYGIIKFLPLDEICEYRIGKQKQMVISHQIGEYTGLRLLWNRRKRSVTYYDDEHQLYGEFAVSFTGFIHNLHKYLHGIFTDEYFKEHI